MTQSSSQASREKCDGRLRDLETWVAEHGGKITALWQQQHGINARVRSEIDKMEELFRMRDDVYQARFDKITRAMGWTAGALAALVFIAQVVLPMMRNDPNVIQIVPAPAEAHMEPGSGG